MAPGPGLRPVLLVFLLALVLLCVNGRPVGDSDGSGAGGALLGLALSLASTVVRLDAAGAAIVGKLLAALFAAGAAAFLFAAAAHRHATAEARGAALVLALGTTLAAAAQAWSGEAPATFLVAVGLWALTRADENEAPVLAARAGLPLALAAALQPSVLPLAVLLVVAAVVRFRNLGPSILGWAAAGATVGILGLVASSDPSSSAAAAAASPAAPASLRSAGLLALVASPAKGLLVFTPVALVGVAGLLRAWLLSRRDRHWDQPRSSGFLPIACGLGVLVHVAAVAALGAWDQGVFWGPRWLAPAWPLLLLFLPEGLAWAKLPGLVLVVVSILVQATGLLSYDGRWDRLHREADGRLASGATWDVARSPLVFQWREGVLRPAFVVVQDGRLTVREQPLQRGGTTASFVTFDAGRVKGTGADPTLEALRLEQGARVDGTTLLFRDPGDALAFRVREASRTRRLQLRVVGTGSGTLGLGDGGSFGEIRWRDRAVAGGFRVRLLFGAESRIGPNLMLALRSGGPIRIESVALVPPGEPENVIRLP